MIERSNTYCKLLLELGVVVGTQVLHMLQERLLVDRPDNREREDQTYNKKTFLSDCDLIEFLTCRRCGAVMVKRMTYFSDFL